MTTNTTTTTKSEMPYVIGAVVLLGPIGGLVMMIAGKTLGTRIWAAILSVVYVVAILVIVPAMMAGSNLSVNAVVADPTGQILKTNIKAVRITNMGSEPINITDVVINGDVKCAMTKNSLEAISGGFNPLTDNWDKARNKENPMGGIEKFTAGLLSMSDLFSKFPVTLGVGGYITVPSTCGEIVNTDIKHDGRNESFYWNQ